MTITHDDHVAAVRRLLEGYCEAKLKRAVLVEKCKRIARVLDAEARRLRSLDGRDPTLTIDSLVPHFPDRSALSMLLKDLADANKIVADNKTMINAAGLTVD